MLVYYAAILGVSLANLLLAAVAYTQRARQIAGNRLRERQLALAETENRLARTRVRCLDDQTALLTEIRDRLSMQPALPGRRMPSPPLVGVIDVGSISVRLQIGRREARGRGLELVDSKGFHAGLGSELERAGCLGSATLDRLHVRLAALAKRAHAEGCERLAVVVTAPGRSGTNKRDLLAVIQSATGRRPDVLSPEREAELAFLGASTGYPLPPGRTIVCDVGGGSTEVATSSLAHGVVESHSFAVGAVTLAERCFRSWPPKPDEVAIARSEADAIIELCPGEAPQLVLAAGGSARALRKLAAPVLGPEQLATALTEAVSLTPLVKSERRRSLPAGIVILQVLHSRLGLPLTIAPGGLREGVLLRLSDPSTSTELLPDSRHLTEAA
jgi:exopolyphosphatase/guanosine-5'-triphosphate,3'-diphosphate pyrophosphatase